MTPDLVTTDAHAPPGRPAEAAGPPLTVLVVSPALQPGHPVAAPIAFTNALSEAGVSVMFAAAVGPLRPELSRAVGYFLIDNAEEAPIKTAHELSRVMRHHRPQVVHAHGALCAVVTALAVRASHVRCARVMTHSAHQLRRLPRWIKGPMLTHCADRYVATSEALKAELEGLGVPAERICVDAGARVEVAAHESLAAYRGLVGSENGTNPPRRV